jgi:uncharacterized protein YdiU (UPF0061 family)
MIKEEILIEMGWNLDNSYARLPESFYARLNPTPVRSPQLVILNESLATSLGLDIPALQSEAGVATFAGNRIPEGALPLAQAYAGHQFGHFTMLGDGRTLLLGEQITPLGERFDIQLKGSGKTPYSRQGDGRAALGPMLREYIISEAMHGLGIATTRSLAVVTTGEAVIRQTELPGAILTRVAASHLRVGTFQYVAKWGVIDELRSLADYTLKRHFPEVEAGKERYLLLLREVMKRQAALIAQWQMVGFIHGVMNTDNMAISGETIDYGPCAFMNTYDPATVFSSIDLYGRYAYGNQPSIAGWNLARFAETLLALLHEDQAQAIELAQKALDGFFGLYQSNWLAGMRAKLGIFNREAEDQALIEDLQKLMEQYRADYTNTFRALTLMFMSRNGTKPDEDSRQKPIANSRQPIFTLGMPEETVLFETTEFTQWHQRWQARLGRQPEAQAAVLQLMRKTNPAIIPRNHRVEAALEAAVDRGDYSVMERLLGVLDNPYAYTPEQAEYATPPAPSACPYRTFCGT